MASYRSIVFDSDRMVGFPFRTGDIVVDTPPKCGTTWMQQMVAQLLFDGTPPSPMSELSPWVEQHVAPLPEVIARLEAQEHRRIIKSHTPLDGFPWHDDVQYLVVGRDPRDACVSMQDHIQNMDFAQFFALGQKSGADPTLVPARLAAQEGPNGDIPPPPPMHRSWIDSPLVDGGDPNGLRGMLHLLRLGYELRHRPNVAVFHYADLLRDLTGEMRRLADFLQIDVTEERLPDLVDACRFDSMKARAEDTAPNAAEAMWRDTSSFFRAGGTGRWEGVLSDDDLAEIERVIAAEPDPGFREWLVDGSGPQVS